MNITVLFNPLRGRFFPMNHHFLVSYSHRTNPFPSHSAIFPLQLNSLRFPPTIPFCGPSSSPLSPRFSCQLLRKHLFRGSNWPQLPAPAAATQGCRAPGEAAPAGPQPPACSATSRRHSCAAPARQRFLPETGGCQKCCRRDSILLQLERRTAAMSGLPPGSSSLLLPPLHATAILCYLR